MIRYYDMLVDWLIDVCGGWKIKMFDDYSDYVLCLFFFYAGM